MSLSAALLLTLTLAPSQTGGLTLANERLTYGILGAPRADGRFLPGDSVALSFDIVGIKADETGKVQYSVGMEVLDGSGKAVFKQAPRDLEANASLGGNSVPGFAAVQVGLDQPPGKYTLKVMIMDRSSQASATLSRAYEILPKGFGLVRLNTSLDPNGRFIAPVVAEGQSLWVNLAAVGFGRDSNGNPNLGVSLSVLDEASKPTLARPYTGEVTKDVAANVLAVPLQFNLDLNRPGKFTVEITATDKIGGKKTAVSLPLVVQKMK
jgi:hypothetical protein